MVEINYTTGRDAGVKWKMGRSEEESRHKLKCRAALKRTIQVKLEIE
jgi:hypothetical protein